MLTNKFPKVFWLSLLAAIFMIISVLLFIPSVIYVGKSKQIQHYNFSDINFIVLITLEIIFIALLTYHLISSLIRDLKNKSWAQEKTTRLKTIMFYTVSFTILVVLVISSLLTQFGFINWEQNLKPLGIITKNADGTQTHSIFAEPILQQAKKVNDSYKYSLLSLVFVYFFIIFAILVAKISLMIKSARDTKKQNNPEQVKENV
ncbi:Uncharacterised protein [Mycoplasmopsis californica]|uniref:Uncharacterized protein n=1 Tax=Mycoplasmopsis equigenitalium TaxID=114883 RepID=A0ABY5J058_9BACT|nr:hypothetical protein [Mycoplasmopsis equigenitalium]UUD36665.1 hypothetical protein NPA09_01955 [Mycoplasmopsis equigenitalium]VEU69373.1 Uncharacterised protein [Mycoplasmopsis californica]